MKAFVIVVFLLLLVNSVGIADIDSNDKSNWVRYCGTLCYEPSTPGEIPGFWQVIVRNSIGNTLMDYFPYDGYNSYYLFNSDTFNFACWNPVSVTVILLDEWEEMIVSDYADGIYWPVDYTKIGFIWYHYEDFTF